MSTKKDLLKQIEKLKKNELLKIVAEYCPYNKKGGFLFVEEGNQRNVSRNNNQRRSNNLGNNNKKRENNRSRSIRQEIVFNPSKLGEINNQSIMNNNRIYNVIDYNESTRVI